MEPESSLPYSQVPGTCPYPEPTPSSPYNPLPLPEDQNYTVDYIPFYYQYLHPRQNPNTPGEFFSRYPFVLYSQPTATPAEFRNATRLHCIHEKLTKIMLYYLHMIVTGVIIMYRHP
jgi:hypothetical protein